MSDGETIEEAIANGIEGMRGWIEAMRAEGHPIPAPTRSEARHDLPGDKDNALPVGRAGRVLVSSLKRLADSATCVCA